MKVHLVMFVKAQAETILSPINAACLIAEQA